MRYARFIYNYGSNKSTGLEIGKLHLCALGRNQKPKPYLGFTWPTKYTFIELCPAKVNNIDNF